MSTNNTTNRSSSISTIRAGKLTIAHLFTATTQRPLLLLAVCLLAALAATDCSSAAATEIAAAGAAASASATASVANHNQQPPQRQQLLAQQMKWEQQQQINRRQAEADQLLDQLLDLEAQPASSLDECALWFNLNVRHRELLGPAAAIERSSALQKEAECDQLEQIVAESRDRLSNFKRLLKNERKQLEFVGQLADEYMELRVAAQDNEQLARQLNDLRLGGGKAGDALEELEQLLDFVGRGSPLLASDRLLLPEATTTTTSQAAVAAVGPMRVAYLDELAELDAELRQLIDREQELNGDELGRLAELGGILERKLAQEGTVELGSGRFRSLSGTLDAVRTIVMHRLAEDEEAQQRERNLAEQEIEMESHRQSVRDRMDQLQVGARMSHHHHLPSPLIGSAASSMAASAVNSGSAGAMAGASAVGQQLAMGSHSRPQMAALTGATAATTVGVGGAAASSSASGAILAANNRLQQQQQQPDRSRIDSIRMQQQQQQQRRFADQLAQQQRVAK